MLIACLMAQFQPSRCSRTVLACLCVLAAALFFTSPSQASWGAFTSTGSTTGIGNPSCAQVSTEHVVCAVLSAKAQMMVNEYSETKWGSWTSLAGSVVSAPSCTNDGTGKVFCAATAATGDLEVAIFSGTSWGTPTQVTAALYSAPSCAKYLAGEVLCVARNATGDLSWSLYSNGKWSAFASLAITALYAPSCTSDGDNGVICSVITTGGTTVVDRYAAGAWKSALNIGGLAGAPATCNYWQPTGQVTCFAKAQSSGLYVTTFNGGTWSTANWSSYGDLGGVANEAPSCTTQTTGDLVCGVIGTETNEFYSNVYTDSSNSWTGWTLVGGTGTGPTSCVPFETGKAICLVMGVNNELSSTVGP